MSKFIVITENRRRKGEAGVIPDLYWHGQEPMTSHINFNTS